MRKFRAVFTLLAVIFLVFSGACLAGETGGKTTPFTVARLVVAQGIKDREPENVTDKFPASAETAYCFLEAKDIAQDTEAVFVWYKDGQSVAKVNLKINQGARWRTYSSKKLAGEKGDWKVELQDKDGSVLKSVEFKVE